MKLASLSIAVGPHLFGLLLLAARGASLETITTARDVKENVVRAPEEIHATPERQEREAPRQLAAPTSKPARTLMMHLEHGESVPEGRPNTWVHIPATRDAASDLRLTFVFHGFKNCIESYTSAGIQCTARNIKRPGYQIAAQLERAGSHSIVVVPETSFDVYSAEAPTLSRRGAFRAYVEELLDAISGETANAHLEDVRRFALVASSGGYQTLEPVLDDVSAIVTDVLLLDAGYMYPNSAVGRFLTLAATEPATSPSPRHRAGILYTPSGGAMLTSAELLRVTAHRLETLGAPDRARLGRVRGDPSTDDLSVPLYVLRVDEEHDVVVRRNLGRVIASAGL